MMSRYMVYGYMALTWSVSLRYSGTDVRYTFSLNSNMRSGSARDKYVELIYMLIITNVHVIIHYGILPHT